MTDYGEALSSVRATGTPLVVTTLRDTALNLHQFDNATNIAEVCRETAFDPTRDSMCSVRKGAGHRRPSENAPALG